MPTLFDQLEITKTERQFHEFDRENPQVWEKFRELAFALIARGVKRYGAKAIFEIMRYETILATNDPNFKLNNNYTAFYARKFMSRYPNAGDFFEIRERKNHF